MNSCLTAGLYQIALYHDVVCKDNPEAKYPRMLDPRSSHDSYLIKVSKSNIISLRNYSFVLLIKFANIGVTNIRKRYSYRQMRCIVCTNTLPIFVKIGIQLQEMTSVFKYPERKKKNI